jgi:hypothetical protein
MTDLPNGIRTRLVPAILTAIGVALLAVGLLSFTTPTAADPLASSSPSPTPLAAAATSIPRITLPPLGSGGPPTASASAPADRVTTRIRIDLLGIDLPVMAQPDPAYPSCDVAMYHGDSRLGQPGQGRATYIYAHAQRGMFLPMLTESKISNGKKMKGMIVDVWTSDDQHFLYQVTEVRRHVPFDDAFVEPISAKTEQLWLQTSEGRGTQPKLQLVALPLSQEPATHGEANPTPKPRDCRPR